MKFLTNVPSTTSTRSEFYFDRKPDQLSTWETIKKYLWDKENRTVCNRGGRGWCLFIGFYLVFLICAFTIFAGMLFGAISGIKATYPDEPLIPHDAIKNFQYV